MGPALRSATRLVDDVPIEQLLPSMVSIAGDGPYRPGRWFVATPNGSRLDPRCTPAQAGLQPGDSVLLARRTPAVDSIHLEGPPQMQSEMPRRLGLGLRVIETMAAFTGIRVPVVAEGAGPLERLRATWRWSQYHRRLDWLIGCNRLNRPVVIGVTSLGGRSSTQVAIDLAHRLAVGRSDRISLVDGDTSRATLTRVQGSYDATVEELGERATWALPDIDARFARPIARMNGANTQVARPIVVAIDRNRPPTPGIDAHRVALERLRVHSAVMIVDAGPSSDACPMLELVDQIVVCVDQTPGSSEVRELERLASDRPTILIDTGAGMDNVAMRRLIPGTVPLTGSDAALAMPVAVVDGWASLGALVREPLPRLWI